MNANPLYICPNCNWTGTEDFLELEIFESEEDGIPAVVDTEVRCPDCQSYSVKLNE